MGAMGHGVSTLIGINHQGLLGRIQSLVPDYMMMGERGMYDMKEMEMPLPLNTFRMMAGKGPYGPIGMGGMFTVLKVREDLAPDDYRDPGWYQQPPNTQAHQWNGPLPKASKAVGPDKTQMPSATVKKPKASGDHGHH